MTNKNLRDVRLNKEQINILKQPLENAIIIRQGTSLNFYFCLYGLDYPFKDGFYFGLLELHQNYPFAPPKLFVYTPNGRYENDKPICTSFTNYHPENWTSVWNVKSLIQGTISFMYSDETSYGCIADTPSIRMKYAKDSLEWNLRSQKFKQLFLDTIISKHSQFIKRDIIIHSNTILNLMQDKGDEVIITQEKQAIEKNQQQKIKQKADNKTIIKENDQNEEQQNNKRKKINQRNNNNIKPLAIYGTKLLIVGGIIYYALSYLRKNI